MLDLAAVALTYAAIRLYERQRKNKKVPLLPLTDQDEKKAGNIQDSISLKQGRHYRNMSAVTVGTAALRMLIPYPPFVLLNFATYTYTMLPFYREVEKAVTGRLLEKREVDSYLLMGVGNILLLGMGRYCTAAVGVGLAYVSDGIRFRAKETAKRQLKNNIFDNIFDPHQKVWIIQEGVELEVQLAEVQFSDILVVKAGEMIPVDGEVVSGMASVDQHAFTGESYPVEKGNGEKVYASTLILTGMLQVRVEKSGHETTIAKIGDILTHSLHGKTDTQLRGEQWAEAANLPFLALAGFGLIAFGPVGAAVILSGNTVQAVRTLAPLATINYQAVASHQQILIKQGQQLEQISSIDTLLFDKTGTLTDGELEVHCLHTVRSGYSEHDILFYAALAENKSTHPIAEAIMRYADQSEIRIDNISNIEYKLGYGIMVQFNRRTIHVGSARFMTAEDIPVDSAIEQKQNTIHAEGRSLVLIAVDHQVVGIVELGARLRPEVKAVFAELRRRGVKQIGIVSGDHAVPTQKLANFLGVEHYFAEVLPEDKADIVKQFQKRGHRVCFVGDGVNDTIAMNQADLSVSLRGATALATDVADIILTAPDLQRLVALWELSEKLEANLRRGLNICYLGMGTVLLGTAFIHMDILAAMGVHFVLGSTAVGNAMLPLLEVKDTDEHSALRKENSKKFRRTGDSHERISR
ncbi:MAG: heavy metal translocating P-type ATPase [Candidatus Electrothrix sp. MAN1_4]|nr:heavy metal translocating P-type ATPase [Candidatus Electrothrix sp. MAN1_4]